MEKKNSEPKGSTAQTTRKIYIRVDPNTGCLVAADTLTINGKESK